MQTEIVPSTPSAEDVVRALYAAVASHDVAAITRWLHPEVVFHVPGRSPNTGDYRGVSAVLGFLADAGRRTGGTLRLELRDVAVGRDHVVAIARYLAQKPGKTLENNLCHLVRVEDGKVRESRFYTGDQYAVDAFWND